MNCIQITAFCSILTFWLINRYGVIWRGKRDLPNIHPLWISIATETLQYNAQVDGDSTLVALVRTSSLFADVSAIKEGDSQMAANCQLILRRLEEEFLEMQTSTKQLMTGLGEGPMFGKTFLQDTDKELRSDSNAGHVCRYIP